MLHLPIQSTYLIQAALEGIVTYKLMKLELPRPLIAFKYLIPSFILRYVCLAGFKYPSSDAVTCSPSFIIR